MSVCFKFVSFWCFLSLRILCHDERMILTSIFSCRTKRWGVWRCSFQGGMLFIYLLLLLFYFFHVLSQNFFFPSPLFLGHVSHSCCVMIHIYSYTSLLVNTRNYLGFLISLWLTAGRILVSSKKFNSMSSFPTDALR